MRVAANGGACGPDRDPAAGAGIAGRLRLGGPRPGLRRSRLRAHRRQPGAGRGLRPGGERDSAGEQLLAGPAAARRRALRAERWRAPALRASRPGVDRHAGGALRLPDRPPSGRARGGLGRCRRGGDLPGPARVPGHADGRAAGGNAALGHRPGDAVGRRQAIPVRLAGPGTVAWRFGAGPAGVPRYLAAARGRRPRLGSPRLARGRCQGGGSCSPGSPWSSLPGPSATRSRSTASCPCPPAAARFSSPAPTCPRGAIRNRSAPRYCSGIPDWRASCQPTPVWSRSSPRLAAQRYPGVEADARSRGWAANDSGTTSPNDP